MKNNKLVNVFAGLIMWVLASFVFMITVGVVRGEWLHNLPTVGFYPESLLLTALFTALYNLMTWDRVMNNVYVTNVMNTNRDNDKRGMEKKPDRRK